MSQDIRNIEYNPFLPSVESADGAIFQVLITDPETGEQVTDMPASVSAMKEYEAGRP